MACVAVAGLVLGLLVLTRVGTGGLAGAGERGLAIAPSPSPSSCNGSGSTWPLRLSRPAIVLQAAAVVVGYAVAITSVYQRFVIVQSGAAPPFLAIFAVVTATIVLSNIPVSLNGLGLREQLHASLMAPLGIAPEIAVAISLLLYAHLVVASLIGLAFWLRAR